VKKLPFIIAGGAAGAVLLAGVGILAFFMYRASQSIWVAGDQSYKSVGLAENPAFQPSNMDRTNPAFNYL
jgi:hypothetical protein